MILFSGITSPFYYLRDNMQYIYYKKKSSYFVQRLLNSLLDRFWRFGLHMTVEGWMVYDPTKKKSRFSKCFIEKKCSYFFRALLIAPDGFRSCGQSVLYSKKNTGAPVICYCSLCINVNTGLFCLHTIRWDDHDVFGNFATATGGGRGAVLLC